MSDIRKKLVISGEIDKAFKNELKNFAKEISTAFKIDGKDIKEAASALSQAAKELKQAVAAVKSGSNINVQQGGPGGNTSAGGGIRGVRGPAAIRRPDESSQSRTSSSEIFLRNKLSDIKAYGYKLKEAGLADEEIRKIAKKASKVAHIAAAMPSNERSITYKEQFTNKIKLDADKRAASVIASNKAKYEAESEASKEAAARLKEESQKELQRIKAESDAKKKAADDQLKNLKKEEAFKAKARANELKAIGEKARQFSDLLRTVGVPGRISDRLGNVMAGGTGGMSPRAAMLTRVGAGVAGVALGAAHGYTQMRELQVMMQHRRQAFGREALSEGVSSALIGKAGRDDKWAKAAGAIKGGAIGTAIGATAGGILGTFGGPIGTMLGVKGGSLLGASVGAYLGGTKGALKESEAETKRKKEETALALENTSRARSHRAARLDLMRGGLTGSGSVSAARIEAEGAEQGFTAEESISQAKAAKTALGAEGLANLGAMRGAYNTWGLSIGEQAQTAQAQLSLGGTTSVSGALTQQEQMMKKAMAAGFDQSKAGKAMVSSVEYAVQSAGMGTVDTNAIQEQLMRFVQGTTGGKRQATDQDMSKAIELQQRLKSESTAKGGLAGLGNMLRTMEGMQALGPGATTEDFLNLMNLSSDSSVEHFERAFGKSKGAELHKLSSAETNMGRSLKQLGLGQAWANLERNITTEQGFGISDMEKGKLGTARPVSTSMTETTQFKSAVLDAKISTGALTDGFKSLNTEVGKMKTALKEFSDSVRDSRTKFNEYMGTIESE